MPPSRSKAPLTNNPSHHPRRNMASRNLEITPYALLVSSHTGPRGMASYAAVKLCMGPNYRIGWPLTICETSRNLSGVTPGGQMSL